MDLQQQQWCYARKAVALVVDKKAQYARAYFHKPLKGRTYARVDSITRQTPYTTIVWIYSSCLGSGYRITVYCIPQIAEVPGT
jgi:hypothetical protein